MASNLALLPFINRNWPQTLDCNEAGLVAYGSRSCVYILNLKSSPPAVLDSKVLRNGHRGRVLSVSFCKSGNELLASVGEDCTLRIWDLETSSCICYQEVKEPARVVEWLYDSANSVVYPDSCGCVCKWNFRTNNKIRMKTCSDSSVSVLSSNQKCPELLAAGHSVGSISVLDVNDQVLLHKLRIHTMDITSLSWSRMSPTMLLSTSLDQTARVWKLGEDKPMHTYCYPKSRFKLEDKKNFKICAVFHPENPDVIICSNVRGDLGAVSFKENAPPTFTPYDARDCEFGFKSINIMMPYLGENNKIILLTSDHLKLALWDIYEQKLLSTFNYISGSIYDLALSPHYSNLIAAGAGDGFLRVWNASEHKLEITTIYIHSRIKIMSVAWHPVEESIIAYGSDEGRVGIADFVKKKSLYSFETHHGNAVYSLQWAPCQKIKDSEEEYFLYSCGGGSIYIHELHKPKVKPADFDALVTLPPDLEKLQKSYSELSWKSDYTYLAIGHYKGFVELYDHELNFLTRVTIQMKGIESLKWHPMYTFATPNGSNYSSWVAVAGNDENIHIFDASDVIKEPELSVCKSAKTLVGHKKRISSVCWSPHTDGFMVSASRDGTVQVWNVITSTPIANYAWHKDVVFAVQWSMYDSDVIYSGGMDNCLRIWKISEQTESSPPKKSQVTKHKVFKLRPKETNTKELKPVEENSFNNEACKSENKVNETEKSEAEIEKELSVKAAKDKFSKTKTESQHFKDKRSFFTDQVFKSQENVDIFKLTDLLHNQQELPDSDYVCDNVTAEESLKCGFYCDQLTALKMLKTKGNYENDAGNIEKAFYFHLMANNVEPLLTSASEKTQLTDFLVAAAPTVSRAFYYEMCEKYAVQLIEERSYMKASMYLLCCGKPHSAVKLLLEKEKVIDALAIAKARLPESDPLLLQVLSRAARLFSLHHQTENEVACHLAMKQPLQAAKTLYCVADSKSIYASAYICYKYNLKEEAEIYGYFCMEKCLSQSDWPTFYKVADLIESLKVYKVLVRVHELFITHVRALKKEDALKKIFGATGSKLQIWESKKAIDSNLSFLPYVYDVIKTDGILPEERELLEEIHKALDCMEQKRKKYELSTEAHVNVAICISQIIVTSFLNEYSLVTKYFMKILHATYNIVYLPKIICWLLLPIDIFWCSNENTLLCESKYLGSELLPFTKHFQNIFMLLCNKFASVGKCDSEEFSISHVFSSNLNATVKEVLAVLSKKTTEDGLLLYFSICYLNELRLLAKNGWKFRCYNSMVPCIENDENTVNGNGSLSVECNQISAEKDIMFISDVTKENEECDGGPEGKCANSENQNIESIIDTVKDGIGIFPPELDICTKNKIAQHHGWADFSEFANKVINTAQVDKMDSSPVQNLLSSIAEKDNLNIPASPLSVLKNINCEIEEDETSSLSENISCNIEGSEKSLSDCIDGKIEGNGTSLNSFNGKVGYVLSEENNVENGTPSNSNGEVGDSESLPEDVNNKYKENEPSSPDNPTDKIEEGMFSSSDDDDHFQCWADISLFYVVTKFFISTSCRDEYALLYYLQKHLQYLDNTIADLTRQQTAKSVLSSNSNQVSNFAKKNSSSDIRIAAKNLIENNNNQEISVVSDSLKSYVTDSIESDPRADGIVDSARLEKEVKNNSSENCVTDEDVICINNVDGKDKLSDEIDIKMPDEDREDKITSSNMKIGNDMSIIWKMTPGKLQTEHENISEQMKLLKSKEFFYPNPFDSVSAINRICCDICHKHPCKFIKKNFHKLAHEVKKWNAKFCTDNEILKCDICQETVSA